MSRSAGPLSLPGMTVAVALAFVAAACAGAQTATPTPRPATTAAVRPASPAVVTIAQPTAGTVVTGTSVRVVITLTNARVVDVTTVEIRPDEGHIHLYVNNALVTMDYGLEQEVPVVPGTYVLKAEFVAADHAPFNPRVWSPETFFTVH